MKRSINVFFMVCLFVSFSLFHGCSGKINLNNFYGKWKSTRDSGTLFVNLSSETWVAKYDNSSSSYTIEELIWKKIKNNDSITKDEYPSGYSITGTVSQVNNISDIKLGELSTFLLFLNKDKTKMLRKSTGAYANSTGSPDYIFSKVETLTQ